ncbi:MAG TPA: hypothetical protein VES65_07235 [Solirubrobacteraceae bacterium]|nr:hypothetical protein [Solirubrobacteraceae bacterium]
MEQAAGTFHRVDMRDERAVVLVHPDEEECIVEPHKPASAPRDAQRRLASDERVA